MSCGDVETRETCAPLGGIPRTDVFFVGVPNLSPTPLLGPLTFTFKLPSIPKPREERAFDDSGSVQHLAQEPPTSIIAMHPPPELPQQSSTRPAPYYTRAGHERMAPTVEAAMRAFSDLKVLLRGES
jgi:hypothetical protein